MLLESLSIMIPTYNRYDKLINALEILAKNQNITRVKKITIIDNATENKTFLDIPENLRKMKNLDFIKNPTNLGLSGNLIKCFECCTTEWMWILGDDDIPHLDAIARIDVMDFDFINFNSHIHKRQKSIHGTGLKSFISDLDNYSNCLFISASIYRLSKFKKYLNYGINNTNTLAPHIPVILRGIKDNLRYALLPIQLVSEELETTPSWEITEQSLSFSSIPTLDFLLSEGISRELFQKMTAKEIPPVKLYFSVLKYSRRKGIKKNLVFIILRKSFSERYLFSSIQTKLMARILIIFHLLFSIIAWKLYDIIEEKGLLNSIRS
jgi:uncharacterized membrane protein